VSQSKARAGRRSVTLHFRKLPHFIVTTFSTPWSSLSGSVALMWPSNRSRLICRARLEALLDILPERLEPLGLERTSPSGSLL
jgi:hypothetical protein